MELESKIFERKRADFEKLSAYGFRKKKDGYFYTEDFMDGEFRAEIHVDGTGHTEGKVFESETGEEYLPVRVAGQHGAFVSEVRAGYAHILGQIAENCFTPVVFISEQANRLAGEILQQYGDRPDFPWKTYPGNGVFRNPSNQKWYALILPVSKNKLEGETEKMTVEIMNVKADPRRLECLHQEKGIYPSWHMDKKNWISILLDGTVPDGRIMELIETSHAFTLGK